MKILHLAATTGDLRRLAPVVAALRRAGDVEQSLVHTGSPSRAGAGLGRDAGRDLPQPTAHLGIGPASPAVQAGRAMIVLERTLRREAPDWVTTIGDAPAVLGGAIAAAQLGLREARLEAGLRSHDADRSDDVVRALADRVADALFTSEPAADENLAREGVPAEKVHPAGSLTIDVLDRHLPRAAELEIAADLGLEPRSYLLALLGGTRDQRGLASLLEELGQVALETATPVVLPLAPEVASAVRTQGAGGLFGALHAIGSLGYVERIALLARAGAVLTDSGPVQEEAMALGIPCLVPGRSTERPITVTRGTSRLVPREARELGEVLRLALSTPTFPRRPELWDGRASERVAATLLERSAIPALRRPVPV